MTNDPEKRSGGASRLKPVARRAGLLVLALVLAAGVIAVVVHTPAFRRFVLRYAVTEVQRRYGIRLEAARLDYNLASLRIGLAEIRIAVERSPDAPFFEADYLRASLSRRVLMGIIALDEIAVTGGRIHIVRNGDGLTNLPESSDSRGGEPAALDIERLVAPGFRVDVEDAQADLTLRIPGINIDIGRAAGRISLVAPATLSAGMRSTRVSTLEGGAAFDGRALRLSNVQLRADEGSARLDGVVFLLVRDGSVDLRATGTADVERLARWGIENTELPRGTIAFEAHATGVFATPVTDIQISSPRLTWSSGAASGGLRLIVADLAATSRVTTARAEVQDMRFSFAGGKVTGKAQIPFDDSAAHLNASWSDIDATSLTTALSSGVDVAPSGTLSGDLDAVGSLARLAQWSATARVHAEGGTTGRTRVAIPGDTRLQLADGRWRIDARHRAGDVVPLALVAAGELDEGAIANSTIAGTLAVSETDVPALIRLLRLTGIAAAPEAVVTAGTLEASVTLGGRLGTPEIAASIRGRSLAGSQLSVGAIDAMVSGQPLRSRLMFSTRAPTVTLADQALSDVQASGRLAENLVRIDTLSAGQTEGPGSLTAAGNYDLRSEHYDVTLDVMRWSVVAATDQPFEGQVEATFRGAGSVSEPLGSGSLRIARASWSGTSLGGLAAEVQLDGQLASFAASAPDFNATLTGRAGVSAPYAATADVRVDGVDLERLIAGSPPPVPVTGRATVAAHAEGPLQMWRDVVASLDVTSLDATAGELTVRLVEPARLRYQQRRLSVETLEVDAGATRLSASGDLPVFELTPDTRGADLGPPNGDGLILTITGDIGEAARAVTATGLAQVPVTEGSGPLALLARVTGSLEKPVVVADLEAGPGSVTIRDLSTASNLIVRAHLERDTLDLREAHASYEGAMLSATGSAPIALFTPAPATTSAPASLHATATGITPAVLRGIIDPTALEDISGAVDVTLNVQTPSLDLTRATGDLTIGRLEVLLGGLPVTQRAPTRIVAQNGFARIESWDWGGQGASLVVRGQVRLADHEAAILANGDVDLRILTPFVRSAGVAVAGHVTPRLSVTGPIESPRIDGDAALEGGEVRLLDPRIIVNGLTARAVLTRTAATLAQITGTINGGSLMGNGAVEYEPGAGLSARLSSDIHEMALEFPAGLRSELDAMLQLDVAAVPGQETPTGTLSGSVTILRSAFREPLALVGGLLASMRARATAASAESPSLLTGLALDVALITDEDLIVDNNVARAQLGANLRIVGTAAAPALASRVEIRPGSQLFVGRNIYEIESGVIDFLDPTTIDPQVRIQASTRAGGEDIQIEISGSAFAPSVVLSSSSRSELTQADITALLLTGRTLDQLSAADASFIGTQVIGNLSGDILGFAGRAVGLDTLRLGSVEGAGTRRDSTAVATEVDPTSRLTFGKSLGRNVDLTFSQSLRDAAAQTWIVEYLPLRRVEVRVVSDDSDLRSYGFRHDMSFGGAAAPASAAASASAPAARSLPLLRSTQGRVADVVITGQPAFPEDRLRGLLRLKAGDRFDFGRWQDDRDRLEAFHHQNEHLAARVNASRMTAGDAVTLTYMIDAGPRTAITVTGVELDRNVVQRLEDAWAASIFDEFLVDEATQIVKNALVAQGYGQPTVLARVVAEADVNRLLIEAMPGNRSSETRIGIQLADAELTRDLEARVAERRLAGQVIQDPGVVVRELTDYLRSRGYLRAKVSVGTPRFEGDLAIVPVTVDSGPSVRIGMVTIEGARVLPVYDLENVAGFMTGAPYDPLAVDAARDRLVAFYRQRGFPLATVTPTAAVSPAEPRADIRFRIQEGPRQTIGDVVVVSGNSGVDADVITRAMGLTTGGPMYPDDLVRARSRVFDTGLFRRVDVTTEEIERAASADTSLEPMRVRVAVEAWPALRLRYGFVAAEERSETDAGRRRVAPGLSADLTRRTLFGRAVSLGGAVEYQRRERSARGFLSSSTLMSLPIQSSLALERGRREFAAARVADTNSISLGQQARVVDHLSLSFAYTFERNHTFVAVTTPGVPPFDIRAAIARLTGAAAWDTRDDPVDARRGLLLSASATYAPESLGSDFRFTKYVGQAYAFQSWRQVVLASAARLGVAWGFGGQELVPSERFFAGGARTVRGVAEDSLGEQDFFGPVGGRALLVLNQEARVPIYKWLRGVGFVDAGNVFAQPSGIRLNELSGSIGFGLRLSTPFALLRADYGKVVWGPGTRSSRWVVGIGQAF
jgi:outer membrane protein assembly factor BamA/autotransporter translocation and assembly factor TamB